MKIRPFYMILAVVMAGSVLLASCHKKGAQVSETGGVERIPMQQTTETAPTGEAGDTSGAGAGTTDPTVTPAAGEPSAVLKDGKWVYSIPEPDRSGLNDLSSVNALSKDLFPDAVGTDWYPGKTERNLTTGEVTYVWDRAKETLDLLYKYGGIYRKNEDEKVAYLTFDCGYENGYTGKILDVLKEKNAPGIFFVVGDYVDSAPDLVKRMHAEGHLIGNHTDNHLNMVTDVDAQGFIKEITTLENKVKALIPDIEPMLYWRPPYGACSEWTLAMSQKLGLTAVMWSWAHYDYAVDAQPDVAASLEKAKKGLHNGVVYLFHCVGQTNVDILGDLIDYIRAEGYEIRPICE